MIAKITGQFNCSEEELWQRIEKVKSLVFVCHPLLVFKNGNGEGEPELWQIQKIYNMKLFLFGLIPLGEHRIKLTCIDKEKNLIKSDEEGSIAKVWKHTITFHHDGKRLVYTDEIEIEAGFLTIPVWLFSNIFYRHRQRRWKKLLKTDL